MNIRTILFLMLLCFCVPWGALRAETAAPVTVVRYPDGAVGLMDGTVPIGLVEPRLYLEGWTPVVYAAGVTAPGSSVQKAAFRIKDVPVILTTEVTAGERSVRFKCVLNPYRALRVEQVCVVLAMPYRHWSGASFRAGGRSGNFPEIHDPKATVLSSWTDEQLILESSPAHPGLISNLQNPTKLTVGVSDMRTWSPEAEVRLVHSGDPSQTWEWKTGSLRTFEFTLEFNRPVVLAADAADPARTHQGLRDWIEAPEHGADFLAERALILELRNRPVELLEQKQFEALEAMAGTYRREKSRMPDGTWKLSRFYDAFYEMHPQDLQRWSARIALLNLWRKRSPSSPTALLAAVRGYQGWANHALWFASGGRYTPEDVKLSRARNGLARKILEEAKALSIDDPAYYESRVSLDRGRHHLAGLVRESEKFDPEYFHTHIAWVQHLLGREPGEPPEWIKAADAVFERTRNEELYLRLVARAASYDEENIFQANPELNWERLRRDFQALIEKYPRSSVLLNRFCAFATAAGDKQTAAELYRKIGPDFVWDEWNSMDRYHHGRKWALEEK